jgi:hypothetical protein
VLEAAAAACTRSGCGAVRLPTRVGRQPPLSPSPPWGGQVSPVASRSPPPQWERELPTRLPVTPTVAYVGVRLNAPELASHTVAIALQRMNITAVVERHHR